MPNGKGVVNIDDKFARFSEQWCPKLVARVNDHDVRLARIEGAFDWHHHDTTDEMFLVHKGEFQMHYRDRVVHLKAGDLHVVPRGVEHRPVADKECQIILFERAGEPNTGNITSDKTVSEFDWI